MPTQPRKKLRIWEPAIIGIAAAIGLLAGYNIDFQNKDKSLFMVSEHSALAPSKGGDGRIEEVIRFIETTYVDSINSEKMTLNIINELLDDLDPHSSYITPEELSSHNEKMKGVYRGIGIETLQIQDTFYVASVLPGSNAAYQELPIGSAILAVDGQSVVGQEMAFDSLRSLLTDSSKSNLELTVQEPNKSAKTDFEIDISEITVSSADLAYLIEDKVAYIKMERFNSNTYEQFIESMEKVTEDGKDEVDLILDLRDNPGGYLPQAIKVASQLFDKKGKMLSYTKGLNREKQEFRSTGKPYYKIRKVAILINNYSASASEIVAGAIQDWDRGIILGEKSYGKGLVQEIFPLKNGGALRLTVAKYYTPSGRLIQKSYESETNEFEADSMIVKTKLLARTMKSGMGILPDEKVEQPDHYCKGYYAYLDHYQIMKMHELKRAELRVADFSQSEYEAFANENFEELPRFDCTFEFQKAATYNIERVGSTVEDFARYINESDQTIQSALEYINDPKPIIALLPDEN